MRPVQVIWLFALGCLPLAVMAQDQQILSQTDIMGTARYVSMAGAMTAVGGDPSAVKDNPAGLGVYRRMEIGLTLAEEMNRVHQAELPKQVGKYNAFSATQASLIFSMMNYGRTRGVIANNFMISYHRLANFNRQYSAGYSNEINSLSDVIALKTNGLSEESLQPESRWEDENVGWLSCQGYDTYLINPNGKNWYSILEPGQNVMTHMRVTETGYVNQYSLGWGMNISNKIFVGASLNMISLYHNQTVDYYENFGDSCGLNNHTYISHSGLGIGASVGIIAHPLRWLRLGASLTTPSALSLTTTNYGDLTSYVYFTDSVGKTALVSLTSASPQNRVADRSLRLPLRTSLGVAFQLKNYGLLSLQYDFAHWKNMYDTHSLRIGLEGVIVNRFFLSAGYAVEGNKVGWYNLIHSRHSFAAPADLAENSVRTDANSQFVNRSHYFSTGFGYRTTHFSVHAAYRLKLSQIDAFAHEYATPYDLRALTHSIVVSFGFHTR